MAALRGYGAASSSTRSSQSQPSRSSISTRHHLVGEVLVELALPDECRLARTGSAFEIGNSHRCFEVGIEYRGLVLRVVLMTQASA